MSTKRPPFKSDKHYIPPDKYCTYVHLFDNDLEAKSSNSILRYVVLLFKSHSNKKISITSVSVYLIGACLPHTPKVM